MKKYLFLAPYEYSIGNASEFVFNGALTARIKGKQLVLVVRQPSVIRRIFKPAIRLKAITNKEIFNVYSNDPVIIPSNSLFSLIVGTILDFIYLLVYFSNKTFLRGANYIGRRLFKLRPYYFSYIPTLGHQVIFNPDRTPFFSWEKVFSYNWEQVLNEDLFIRLDQKKERQAEDIYKQMGLTVDKWYVCLHIRELGFHNDSADEGSFRCADINHYIKAIEYIACMGGYVVRMGDSSMKPLPKMKNVVDYPHSPYKSDLMDLYLIKNCKLYIGMDSGIWDTAQMFQKNNLIINSTNWCFAIPPKYGDLIIIKHWFSKSRARFLSVKELLEEPFEICFHFTEVPSDENNDYIIVENSPEEIKLLVSEKLSQSNRYSYSELQRLFCEKRKIQLMKWIEDPFFKNNVNQSYRAAIRYFYQGTVGDGFLKDNWEYSDYLKEMTERFLKTNKRYS